MHHPVTNGLLKQHLSLSILLQGVRLKIFVKVDCHLELPHVHVKSPPFSNNLRDCSINNDFSNAETSLAVVVLKLCWDSNCQEFIKLDFKLPQILRIIPGEEARPSFLINWQTNLRNIIVIE